MFKTHDMSHTGEYRSWTHMRWRCDPERAKEFPNYAGRGITVCQRWQDSFEAFYEDMGPRPFKNAQIDRSDNNGNYEPGNCRWASKQEQAMNRRPRPRGLFVGERNGQAKLSRRDVRALRLYREYTGLSFARVASAFNISTSQTHRICKGASWSAA